MRFFLTILLATLAYAAMPAIARAACLDAASAKYMSAVASKVDGLKNLHGADSQAFVAQGKAVIALATPCLSTGSPDDRALAVAFISRTRYIQEWVLAHDGIPADLEAAVALARKDLAEINAFDASHSTFSGQSEANLHNWVYFDGQMIEKPAQSCLDC